MLIAQRPSFEDLGVKLLKVHSKFQNLESQVRSSPQANPKRYTTQVSSTGSGDYSYGEGDGELSATPSPDVSQIYLSTPSTMNNPR